MGLAGVQPSHKQHRLSVLGAEHTATRPGISVQTLLISKHTKQTARQVRVSVTKHTEQGWSWERFGVLLWTGWSGRRLPSGLREGTR